MARKQKNVKSKKQENELLMYIVAIIAIALSIIAYSRQGILGVFLSNFAMYIFGKYAYVFLLVIIGLYVLSIINRRKSFLTKRSIFACVLLLIALSLYSAIDSLIDVNGFEIFKTYLANTKEYFLNLVTLDFYGGIVGAFLISISSILVDKIGTYIIIVVLLIVSSLLVVSLETYKAMFESIKNFFTLPEKLINLQEEEETEEDYYEEELVEKEPLVQTRYAGVLDDVYTVDKTFEDENKKSIFMTVDPEEKIDPVIEDYEEEVEIPQEPTITKVEEPIKVEQFKTEPEVKDKVVSINGPYNVPTFDILDSISSSKKSLSNQKAASEKGRRLIEILKNFGIEAQLNATHIGPSVTKFEIKPDSSVKVNKIMSIQDNIKMELAARDIRMEAPIPGKNAVGIEIPNVESTPVSMKEIITTLPKDKQDRQLMLALGKDLLGRSVFCQLDKMPHLLIAGATGSGKSVCMNSIITSILLRCHPDDVKLLLIDPKKVEFTQYSKIPHLIGPVISDSHQANNALKVIVSVMDERYEVFSRAQVRNIQTYNDKVKANPTEANLKPLPYIVVIIDELADLMAVAGKEVELSIQRITQLARAAGIHLIVATQRPSTDVITGIIKANIPSRIAFSVSSGIDSRTILDTVGAERLLGNGDMLYQPIGEPSAIRLQGVYVSDDEVARIAEYASSQRAPLFDDAFIRLEGVNDNDNTSIMSATDDPLYIEIKDYVIEVQKASTSLLQRRFGIGYNRAARMIDLLEQNGVIGPQQGSKPREVFIKKEEEIEE